eukprot:m.5064 g.5064  ORF g.5064 m.5064 type:complete len:457 (+) comp4441_c0_seq2:183-1553(+)
MAQKARQGSPTLWDRVRQWAGPKKPVLHEDPKAEGNFEVEENQPRNPYTEIMLLQGHENIVRHIVVLGDERIATAGDDGRIIIWNTRTGARVVTQESHKKPVTALVQLQMSGQAFLVSASVDHTVCIFDVISGTLEHQATDVRNNVKCLVPLHRVVPDHEALLCGGGRDIVVYGPSLELLDRIERDEAEEELRTLLPIKNGRIVASANLNDLLTFTVTNDNGRVRLTPLTVIITGHPDNVHCLVAISEAQFASGGLDGSLFLFSSHTYKRTSWTSQRATFDKEKMPASSLTYYAVNHMTVFERFIFVAIGHGFAIYDSSGEGGEPLVDVPRAHRSTVNRIVVLPRGLRFVTCGDDNAIRLWSFEDCQPKIESFGAPKLPSLDTALAKARERGVKPTCIGEMLGHSDAVTFLVDLPRAQAFVSCSADKTCIVWRSGDQESSLRCREAARNLSGPVPP